MLYGEGWKIALVGTGTVVKGRVSVLCNDYNDALDIIDSFISAAGQESNSFRIELQRVALAREDAFSEMQEI